MTEIRFAQLKVLEGNSPTCSRCGTENVMVEGTDTVMIDSRGDIICDNCMTSRERLAQGRRILAGINEEAQAIRRQWLGDDLDSLDDKARRSRRKKLGPPPPELTRLINQSQEMEETIDNLEYVADSEERLLHHAVTGKWPTR